MALTLANQRQFWRQPGHRELVEYYLNLLTGSMTDQVVTLKTDVILQSILSGTIAAPTLAIAAGTNLGIGAYSYFVTYVDNNNGETYLSNATVGNITTTQVTPTSR